MNIAIIEEDGEIVIELREEEGASEVKKALLLEGRFITAVHSVIRPSEIGGHTHDELKMFFDVLQLQLIEGNTFDNLFIDLMNEVLKIGIELGRKQQNPPRI